MPRKISERKEATYSVTHQIGGNLKLLGKNIEVIKKFPSYIEHKRLRKRLKT